jgi:acetylornithine deacetylase/succinyl-diaminopimelate desuccinylase-like protein
VTREGHFEGLITDLVGIESVTPWLINGGAGEVEIAGWIVDWLADVPVEVRVEEAAPRRPNVVATLRGTGGGKSLCLNAHLDTVGYDNWRDRALRAERSGDNLVGLGAADDKSGVAIGLTVLRELAAGPRPRGDVEVVWTADEEALSIGTEHYVRTHRPNACIVLEPDDSGRVYVEHQGFGWVDLIVQGRAAHGSAPEAGIDAIVHMAEVIRGLHRRDVDVYRAGPMPRNGRTVFHSSTIHGGTDYATYPSKVTLAIEIGTQPGETLADRITEIETTFDEVRQAFPEFSAEIDVKLERPPFVAQGHEQLLEAADNAAIGVLGQSLRREGLNAWADSGLVQAAGIPTIMLGPRGGNYHAPDEWVSLPDVVRSAEIVRRTAETFCS